MKLYRGYEKVGIKLLNQDKIHYSVTTDKGQCTRYSIKTAGMCSKTCSLHVSRKLSTLICTHSSGHGISSITLSEKFKYRKIMGSICYFVVLGHLVVHYDLK